MVRAARDLPPRARGEREQQPGELAVPLDVTPRHRPSRGVRLRATLPGVTERPDFLDHEDLYRRIVESSPAAVALLTNEAAARVLYASPRIAEISGFTPAELIDGDQVWDARLHPDEIDGLTARWTRAVEEETVFEAEYRFRHRNGEWRWFRETNTPVREPDGSVRYRQSFTD